MALDEDFELGDAVEADPDYADEHRDLREVYRRSQTPRQRMLRQAREGFERVPELTEDLLLPQSPLDVAAMAVLGPYGKVGSKAAAGALGLALEPSEAEAALGPGFSKRFFSPLVELVRNLNVNKPMPERAWRELLEPNPKTGKQARFRDARTGLEHPVTPDEWEFARGDEALRSLTRNGPELIRKEDLADLLEEGYPALDTRTLGSGHRGLTPAQLQRYRDLDAKHLRWLNRRGPQLTEDEFAEVARLRPLYESGAHLTESPQYSSYRLKGPAEEYQESLTKFERMSPEEATKRPWEVFDMRDGSRIGRFGTEEEAQAAINSRAGGRQYLDYERTTAPDNSANFVPRAGHFNSEPNLLSHSRADRRTTVDGLKARHVDEFQSDWHQQARDQGGYHINDGDSIRQLEKREEEARDILNEARERFAYARWGDEAGGRSQGEIGHAADQILQASPHYHSRELYEAAQQLRSARVDYQNANQARNQIADSANKPPAAPLRKNWHEVELKKQLTQAVEDGDELLTWTTGDQQIERYKAGLQAAVDELRWTRRPDGKYDIVPIKGGRPVSVRTAELNGLTDRQLEDTIGTEMAKKIRENKGSSVGMTDEERAELKQLQRSFNGDADMTPDQIQRHLGLLKKKEQVEGIPAGSVQGTLSGNDLTVGGAGMRSFYDRTVVDTAKKLAKQYGGEYTRVKVPGERRAYDLARRVDIENLFVDDSAFRQLDEAVSRYAHALPEEKLDELSAQMGNLEDLRTETHPEAKKEFLDEVIKLREMLGRAGRESLDVDLGSVGEHDVHAIKITPQMREKLKAAGGKFSLYADGGYVLPWEERAQLAGGGQAGRAALIALARRLGIDTSDLGAIRSLERQLADEAKPKPEKMDLLDAFGSEGQRDLKKRGIKFYEKPSYWEDFSSPELQLKLGESRGVSDALGYTPREYNWSDIYSAQPRGPQSSVSKMPEESTFIVRLPHGRYLVDRTGARSYIRNWLKLPEELKAVDDVERADGGAIPELPWEQRARLASGGRASRELVDRLRRWVSELGGLPVRELPEEAYRLIEKNAPEGESVLYHGSYSRPPFKLRKGEEGLFLTREPGVAEAFSADDTGWNRRNKNSNELVVPYTASLRKARTVQVPDELTGETLYDSMHALGQSLSKQSLFKLPIEDMIPISKSLLDRRTDRFVEKTYQDAVDSLYDRYAWGERDTPVDHDQYFAPRAGSLRRWRRGGHVDNAELPAWLDEEPVELAGGGDIMRALLRRLGIARETAPMRRMTEDELVRPFAGEASTERQIVDELENPSRRELLFGRAAQPELRTEAESIRNLPAPREPDRLPIAPERLEGESFEGLSPLEQVARQAQRYEPSRRVFMQGAASALTAPKKLELLNDVAPKLVEAAKPKLTVPRSTVMKTLEDILVQHWEKANAGKYPVKDTVWDNLDVMENVDALVAKKLGVPVEDIYQHFDAPSLGYNSAILSDPDQIFDDLARVGADGRTAKQWIADEAEALSIKPKEFKSIYKRLHGRDLLEDVKSAIDDVDDSGAFN